jgi:hypothetical protein
LFHLLLNLAMMLFLLLNLPPQTLLLSLGKILLRVELLFKHPLLCLIFQLLLLHFLLHESLSLLLFKFLLLKVLLN